jgi:queuine/archaeosine tRNA-ribosyltransferase
MQGSLVRERAGDDGGIALGSNPETLEPLRPMGIQHTLDPDLIVHVSSVPSTDDNRQYAERAASDVQQ